jgi:hypothetical protein
MNIPCRSPAVAVLEDDLVGADGRRALFEPGCSGDYVGVGFIVVNQIFAFDFDWKGGGFLLGPQSAQLVLQNCCSVGIFGWRVFGPA